MKPDRIVIEISSENLRKIIGLLKEKLGDEGFYLNTIVGTDYPSDKLFQIDYYITLIPDEQTIVLRVKIPREEPVIDSILDLVPGALPGECEAHDLLGIVFRGNKYLKRGFFVPIEVAEKGIYPLRKDSGV
ncbi:NADH-quinone oxidoreductase subunit C [Desulfurococcaceae archaeon MEX13E-LK6-19]|nr:NADH-quinone oxidoreductase subunit C [Desulfurococcaceae archaeon MEX13E-LK6-19]